MCYVPLEDSVGVNLLESSDRTISQCERFECTISLKIGSVISAQRDVIVTTGTINSPIEIPPC